MMTVRYSKNALKFLSKLDRKSVDRIRTAIAGLTRQPPEEDIKKMQGFDDERLRLRVGGWRIIYRINNENAVEVLLVLDIGNRGDVYK